MIDSRQILKALMLIKKIIKNILPYFVVKKYEQNRGLTHPSRFSNFTFEKDFKEKANILADNRFSCNWEDIWPCLDDNTTNTSFDSHYIYHTAWAARILAQSKPEEHIDIGSSLYFISITSAFCPIKFYDYRPAELTLLNLQSCSGDVTQLPFENNSISSLSCMHVIEHIGLERYGDPFDPQGDLKAMHELERVLKPDGNLLFVVPVGDKMRIQYNAHRIYTFENICECFNALNLEHFSLVTDSGQFLLHAQSADAKKQKYGCGCFWFKKPL
jgi:ubiquinone/menaquinone biosynthesis C-methylase UbiE